MLKRIPPPPRVHFRVVEATEGEHGNVKASDTSKRYFIIHTDEPVALNDSDELVVNFEYRPDPEKNGQERSWRDKRNTEAVITILERLQVMTVEGGEIRQRAAEYLRLLKLPAPTEKDIKRVLLSRYVNQYTARNTMDYFIHKDLGGFLRRELDFYIKNEVMHLDDIENADAPSVETYLEKIKVLRKIAGKLIDFLAQLEDFQKKLWLKKKFVVETNYCITLDRIPEELYAEVTDSAAQCEEWVKLLAIDEIQADLNNPGFSKPLTTEFLKANDKLVLDTCFFDEGFKAKLLASIGNFDGQCDGLLIHSENFQALNLLQERYREQVKCTYIDPPYNTDSSEILYKNSYKHSSWCSLIFDRVFLSKFLLTRDGVCQVAVDDAEYHRLESVLRQVLGDENHIANIAIMHNPKGRDQGHIADCHEYTIVMARDKSSAKTYRFELTETLLIKKYPKTGTHGRYRELPLRRSGSGAQREDRKRMYFPFIYDSLNDLLSVVPRNEYESILVDGKFDDEYVVELRNRYVQNGLVFILPIREDGTHGRWRWGYESSKKGIQNGFLVVKDVAKSPIVYQIDVADETYLPKTLWYGKRYDASTKGTNLLKSIIPQNKFDHPKSIFVVKDMLIIGSSDSDPILDYFAGSGTTGHAVINLNREDDGKRKYILVEMGDYFDTVLKPRIQKVSYSDSWKDGKPTNRESGISHCFKYIRLESYEDTLNNLRFDDNPQRQEAVATNSALKEDYMLHYMLDVETRESQSLLNIDAFANPTAYTLNLKKPGTDEYTTKAVDLIETFNFLIGLRVLHTSEPQTFQATFKRNTDPELPDDQRTKLEVDDNGIQQNAAGTWWFCKVLGWVPKDPKNPNNGQREKVLIIWRRLNGDIEQDNLMLDEWFLKYRASPQEFDFDTIYVNGSNNLLNLKSDSENWKVHLIEEEFTKRMWSGKIV